MTDEDDVTDDSENWMAPIDGDILELMRDDDIFTPDDIAEYDICRGPDAAYRCRELAKRGLLQKHATGMYDITELGEQFLAGEVDPIELEIEDE
ncbi:hypothetical protein D8Y22_22020 [Salinadaptatus halalkaliphilus]|uniref:MarR family transcriptional regulator n=1 Tax=Salinadaptatus halalkaliphilus TaxID=2419781 RepID=A0A4V3VKR7_9EURY|nr:hypothetical protein [Salinadaptatus halalkaliphilus]THE62747.1 hypothetical protein D8Y22_22020 [Salinadaptatus halalkaliphilus]